MGAPQSLIDDLKTAFAANASDDAKRKGAEAARRAALVLEANIRPSPAEPAAPTQAIAPAVPAPKPVDVLELAIAKLTSLLTDQERAALEVSAPALHIPIELPGRPS